MASPVVHYSQVASDYMQQTHVGRHYEKGASSTVQTQGEVCYSSEEKSSKKLGKYKQITIKDKNFKRRFRCILSFFKAAWTALSRLRKTGRIRNYLSSRSVHLRSQLAQDDRVALACSRVFGVKGKLSKEASVSSTSTYAQELQPIFVNETTDNQGGKGDLGPILKTLLKDFEPSFSDYFQTFLQFFKLSNGPNNQGLYEIHLSTAVPGLIGTESHKTALIIDPLRKQFYVIDSKGTPLDKVCFYNCATKKATKVSLADFIEELKTQKQFKDFGVVVTPSFQGVGDCSAAVEAVSRSLAVVRHQLATNKKLSSVDSEYEIRTAVGLVYENYEDMITKDLRPKLEV